MAACPVRAPLRQLWQTLWTKVIPAPCVGHFREWAVPVKVKITHADLSRSAGWQGPEDCLAALAQGSGACGSMEQ